MIISIITPIYQAEAYLHPCIDSILAQTFPDFQLILVDDGSSDRSGVICDEYAAKDSRIKVIHQENRGQAAARNRALDLAQGEYIAFIDSDDYVHPRFLEILWKNARNSQAQVSICNFEKVPEVRPLPDLSPAASRVWEGKDYVRKCMTGQIPNKAWILCDKLFHRSCFAHRRLPEGRIYEDNAVVYQILYEAETIAECDDILYYYFQNQSGTVNQAFRPKHLDWLLVPQEMIEYFTAHGDALLIDKSRRMYLGSLEDMYRKVHTHLKDPALEQELKQKLRLQYEHEKKRYPITVRTHPGLYEILFPTYARLYWTAKAILSKLSKR